MKRASLCWDIEILRPAEGMKIIKDLTVKHIQIC